MEAVGPVGSSKEDTTCWVQKNLGMPNGKEKAIEVGKGEAVTTPKKKEGTRIEEAKKGIK